MNNITTIRIDKWLWAARFFKTRQMAIDAINAGRIHVNDARIKPAYMLKLGERILVRKPPYEWAIVVEAIQEKRGSATIAQAMYIETTESITARTVLKQELKDMPPPLFAGRPTKRDRRNLENFGQVTERATDD